MRKRWIASFALSLGFLATTARAADDPWRLPPPKPTAPPAAQLGRPIALDAVPPAPLPPVVDTHVRPTSYDPLPASNNAVIQAQAPDSGVARPLPVGPAPLASSGPPLTTTTGKPMPLDDSTLPVPRTDMPGPAPSLWGHLNSFSDCGGGDCTGGSCLPNCCPDGCCYNPGNRWYLSAEALLWWMKGNRVPPLVTTGSATDAVPGALGQPNTQVLFGGTNFAVGGDAGGRFSAGYWFTDDHSLGFEASYWFLGARSNDFSASSTGNPLLFRPFTDETGTPNVELVAVPSPTGPGLAGTVTVLSKTSFWGSDADFRSTICCGPHWFIDGLAGFRVMGLDDDLNIRESLVSIVGATTANGTTVPAGTSFAVDDHFRTVNRFYGGQVGVDAEYRLNNWIFGLKAKIALGDTNEMVTINGATTINVPGVGSNTFNGGLLAQASNIGTYTRNQFSVVPEANLSVGYQFNEHWRAFVGYNVIYWSSVVRSGEQIDLNVNRNQIPPPVGTGTTPAFVFHSTDFWAQGINFGVEFKW
jgi:Putative beta barrel porin-7 (BBP7)